MDYPQIRLSLQNISKAYQVMSPLFENLNFDFPPEKILVIAGPNGVGKTTLARVISGKTRPSQGTIKSNAKI